MWQPMDLPYEELPGISRALLSAHFNLYLSYIHRLNEIHQQASAWDRRNAFEYGRLKAEEGFLRNAVRLHELYFENLTPGGAGDPLDTIGDDEMYDRWWSRFRPLAIAAPGWAIYADDLGSGRRFSFMMREHGQGYVALAMPLLVVDCYEHAYMIDYGVSKDDYLDAIIENIDWDIVRMRSDAAISVGSRGMR